MKQATSVVQATKLRIVLRCKRIFASSKAPCGRVVQRSTTNIPVSATKQYNVLAVVPVKLQAYENFHTARPRWLQVIY